IVGLIEPSRPLGIILVELSESMDQIKDQIKGLNKLILLVRVFLPCKTLCNASFPVGDRRSQIPDPGYIL
ncbi:MAG TPA: hypothetical protein V6C65_18910, partial [Allocoleopsis sp.]